MTSAFRWTRGWLAGALGLVLIVTLMLGGLFAWRAVQGALEGKRELASVTRQVRQVLYLQFLTSDLYHWQTLYAFEVVSGHPEAARDDAYARTRYLATRDILRRSMNDLWAQRQDLTDLERLDLDSARRLAASFARVDAQVVGTYRSTDPAARRVASDVVRSQGLVLYQGAASALGRIADSLIRRSEQASARADAGSAQARSALWLSGGLTLALLATLGWLLADLLRRRLALLGQLRTLADTDGLTGIANRRRWDEALPRALNLAQLRAEPLAVALLDLDHFKAYNDRHGHLLGDELLRQIGAALRAATRSHDVVARYGGEEFGLLLPNCDLDGATALLARVRAGLPGGQTFSAGVTVSDGHEPPETVLERADQALYRAKQAGRDRDELIAVAGSR